VTTVPLPRRRPGCDVKRNYIAGTKGATFHQAVGPVNSNFNNTSRTAKTTFTSEVSGTVGIAVSGSLTVSRDFLVAKLEAAWKVDLSASMTTKPGNAISVNTPPHKSTFGKYGVHRLKNTGTSTVTFENCTKNSYKVTTCTPARVGWHLWEQ
jgi:hypothetical protein